MPDGAQDAVCDCHQRYPGFSRLTTGLNGVGGIRWKADCYQQIIIGDGAGSVQLEQAGAIADMTKCVGTWTNKNELLDAAIRKNGDRINGVLPYGNLVALWYNKTLLDKYSLKVPTTTDELEADLKAVTAGGDGGRDQRRVLRTTGSVTGSGALARTAVRTPLASGIPNPR